MQTAGGNPNLLSSSWPYLQRLFHVPKGVSFLTGKLNICMGQDRKTISTQRASYWHRSSRKPGERSDLNASLAQGDHFIVLCRK